MSVDILSLSKPHQTILVCVSGLFSVAGKEKFIDNIITIDWHMPTSFNPPLYCISISKSRFSLKLLNISKCFSINFLSSNFEREVMICGTTSGVNTDKFKSTKLTPLDCVKIDTKYIKEAESVYECEVINEIDTGDHILIIGKIIYHQEFNNRRRIINTKNQGFTTTIK